MVTTAACSKGETNMTNAIENGGALRPVGRSPDWATLESATLSRLSVPRRLSYSPILAAVLVVVACSMAPRIPWHAGPRAAVRFGAVGSYPAVLIPARSLGRDTVGLRTMNPRFLVSFPTKR